MGVNPELAVVIECVGRLCCGKAPDSLVHQVIGGAGENQGRGDLIKRRPFLGQLVSFFFIAEGANMSLGPDKDQVLELVLDRVKFLDGF